MSTASREKSVGSLVPDQIIIDIIAEHGDAAAPHVEAFTRTLADAIHGAKEIAA